MIALADRLCENAARIQFQNVDGETCLRDDAKDHGCVESLDRDCKIECAPNFAGQGNVKGIERAPDNRGDIDYAFVVSALAREGWRRPSHLNKARQDVDDTIRFSIAQLSGPLIEGSPP